MPEPKPPYSVTRIIEKLKEFGRRSNNEQITLMRLEESLRNDLINFKSEGDFFEDMLSVVKKQNEGKVAKTEQDELKINRRTVLAGFLGAIFGSSVGVPINLTLESIKKTIEQLPQDKLTISETEKTLRQETINKIAIEGAALGGIFGSVCSMVANFFRNEYKDKELDKVVLDSSIPEIKIILFGLELLKLGIDPEEIFKKANAINLLRAKVSSK